MNENFRFKTKDSKELLKQKYRMFLQKAKILYFTTTEFKKTIRKNSELLSDFNIFKIKKKQNIRYQRIGVQDKRNIRKFTSQIIKLFSENPLEQFNLDQISSLLNLDKRKIYDLINVLNTVELISKVTKGVYLWKGLESSIALLKTLPAPSKAIKQFKEDKSLSSLTLSFLALVSSKPELPLQDILQ